jgi:hypothetical protein
MLNITFNKEETDILERGLNYALENPVKHFLQDLIIDTENAIKQYSLLGRTSASIRLNTTFRGLAPSPTSGKTETLYSNELTRLCARENYIESCRRESFKSYAIKQLDINEQNTYRFLTSKKLKQIRTKLKQSNLMITKADKENAVVIMNKDSYTHKVEAFLKENQFTELRKDPTDNYQKQIQNAISKSNTLIDRQQKKYLTQIKPQPPTLKAQIKIHKVNEPIRPVVNNIYAPTYKIAKFLNKWLTDTL